MTKAMPLYSGTYLRNRSRASRPPAETPVQAMGKGGSFYGDGGSFCAGLAGSLPLLPDLSFFSIRLNIYSIYFRCTNGIWAAELWYAANLAE